ncbi:MAG: 4'-phosphopantetheinyl transferase superfamily protein [Mameliella sp.]|nr:4'-phosphopantetheinyl transferase superfamily protein [Phaeodactylibacter sp.]
MGDNQESDLQQADLNLFTSLEKGNMSLVAGAAAPKKLRSLLYLCLNKREQGRFNRFKVQTLADVYLSAHAALNTLIGGYLNIPAREVPFEFGAEGKPFLNDAEQKIQFNLSHSGPYFLIGLWNGGALGVDVEVPGRNINPSIISQRFFHPNEQKQMNSGRFDFYDIWTRKEAYLKALGTGLTINTTSFDATKNIVEGKSKPIHVANLSCFEDTSAAVAVEGKFPPINISNLKSDKDWEALIS